MGRPATFAPPPRYYPSDGRLEAPRPQVGTARPPTRFSGRNAFHFHTVGKCDPPSFESAGGHFNPTHHGMLSGPGHAGDMPNLHIPPTGTLELEVLNAAITLDKGKPNSMFHQGGTSAVIHAGKDDYMSDPAGNSGNRIACGVISEGSPTVGRSPAR
jgi:superoxide dismutase, Cu-Zn family